MSLKYSLGFLAASLTQAAIVMVSEWLNITSLGANLTLGQLITHILAGQAAGYLLLFVIKNIKAVSKLSPLTVGTITGVLFWFIALSINSMAGKVNAPWTQGPATLLISILAFIVYGVMAANTIKKNIYTTIWR